MSDTAVHLFISGRRKPTADWFERRSPVTDQVVTRAAAATPGDARLMAESAAKALPSWAATGPSERRAFLMRAADKLEARVEEFVDAMIDEIGATEAWARFNVGLAAGMFREAGALTTQIGGDLIPSDTPGCMAMAVREPAGVVLGIAPWNAPIILGARAIAVPLACGNTVILKGSEVCPRSHALIAEACADAGFPPGVVNLINHAPEDAPDVVGALIDHPAVRRINFTGSTAVGRQIALRAADLLKPVLLELGGKAPMVVLEDADLDEAVNAAAFGAFMNQGQICMSTERIILVPAIADAFVARFKTKVAGLTVGDPAKRKTVLGAVASLKSVRHVEALVKTALRDGAEQIAGGTAEGVVMPPTVVDRVTPAMALFREESFGPVVAIIRAEDEAHAIELANDSEYGLTAAVFTRDIGRGLRVARLIRSGMCHINGPTVQDEAHAPFGGVKSSGYGRFGGMAGIEAFTELRWITVQTQTRHYPF